MPNICPNQDTVNRLAHEMWFVEDAVTIRLAKTEGRMDTVEKETKSTGNKFNAIIMLQLTLLGGLVVDIWLKR